MELQIKKWGVLRDSTIPLPGLTVIGGYNATGKSTVGKLLLAMVKNFRASTLVRQGGEADIPNPIWDVFGGEFDDLQYAEFIDSRGAVLNAGIASTSMGLSAPSNFDLIDAFLLETPFVASLARMFSEIQQLISQDLASVKISYPYAMNDVYGKMLRQRKNVSSSHNEISRHIKEVVSGSLVFESAGFVFVEGERKLDPRSVASGQLGLSIFAKLLENGWISKDTISVFDEPESHMHPHWQLIYAKMLVRCVEELGATIVVTTHTPYMLQALKVFSDQSLKGKAAFCIAERKGDYAQISVDESPDLAKIAPLMTEPMRRIQLLRDWDYES